MAQIIASSGVTVQLQPFEAVLLGRALLVYVQHLSAHERTAEEEREVDNALHIMEKIRQIARAEAQNSQ